MNAKSTRTLFDDIVAASRLQPVIAPFTIRRLLLRSNVVPPDAVTADALRTALPNIESGLRVFLTDEQLDAAMRDIRALAGSAG